MTLLKASETIPSPFRRVTRSNARSNTGSRNYPSIPDVGSSSKDVSAPTTGQNREVAPQAAARETTAHRHGNENSLDDVGKKREETPTTMSPSHEQDDPNRMELDLRMIALANRIVSQLTALERFPVSIEALCTTKTSTLDLKNPNTAIGAATAPPENAVQAEKTQPKVDNQPPMG